MSSRFAAAAAVCEWSMCGVCGVCGVCVLGEVGGGEGQDVAGRALEDRSGVVADTHCGVARLKQRRYLRVSCVDVA